jgi:GH15 family glucan-1,4-alpha-glucosidase
VSNAASHQLQLDTYGEVIDALFQVHADAGQIDHPTQTLLNRLGSFVADHWHLPDKGIWEIRGEPRHHTHSRVLCWTALDRLIRLAERELLPRASLPKLRTERDRIRADVDAHGYAERTGSYTQTLDGDTVDASLLLLPWYGFEDPRSQRMQNTWARIRQRLQVGPGLFHRYEQSREAHEGAFGICSFWAVEFLARGGGSTAQAQRCFEQALQYSNDLGLFAEEIDADTGEALGNFPQAYTHVGLINAALALEERRS